MGSLKDLRKQLESCEADLAAMPAVKRGSEWETDRREEQAWLRRTIARLETVVNN